MSKHTNNTGRYEETIARLSDDLTPVTCLGCPYRRALGWWAAGLVSIILIGALAGFRSDLADKLASTGFQVEMGIALLLALSAAMGTTWLSLPDGASKVYVTTIPYIIIAVVAGIFINEAVYHGIEWPVFSFARCVIDATMMGIVPIAMIIAFMKSGASTHPVKMALMSMIAAGSIGYIGLRLTCSADQMGHVCIYHIVPFVVIGLVLSLLARRLFHW